MSAEPGAIPGDGTGPEEALVGESTGRLLFEEGGRTLRVGPEDLRERDVTAVVRAARDPRAAVCAVTGTGLSRAEPAARPPGLERKEACPRG
ncbi:hypothetical protein [Streptomyces sp. AB3(2024)]|uniref:hypothetical protein n=1 Tax=Streptomyces sp. AB3(2024) TaxID=3317321 RepID=UPI0035A3C157